MEEHCHSDSDCERQPKHESVGDQRQPDKGEGANVSLVVASAFPFKPSDGAKQKRCPQKPIPTRDLTHVHGHLKIGGNYTTFFLMKENYFWDNVHHQYPRRKNSQRDNDP